MYGPQQQIATTIFGLTQARFLYLLHVLFITYIIIVGIVTYSIYDPAHLSLIHVVCLHIY